MLDLTGLTILDIGTALAGSLPFRDESVDFIFSPDCITVFLIIKKEVFRDTIFEVLRTLKKGGQLQLSPCMGGFQFSKEGEQNANQLLGDLKMPYYIEKLELGSTRLRIIKG